MEKDLNWAVLGTGVIANEMAQALQKMGKTMYAVANRTHEKAVAFAEKYGIAKVYDSIDEVFVDDEVDIIYNRLSKSIFVTHPESMVAVYAYMNLKEVELNNITTIIEGIRYNLNPDFIRTHIGLE